MPTLVGGNEDPVGPPRPAREGQGLPTRVVRCHYRRSPPDGQPVGPGSGPVGTRNQKDLFFMDEFLLEWSMDRREVARRCTSFLCPP